MGLLSLLLVLRVLIPKDPSRTAPLGDASDVVGVIETATATATAIAIATATAFVRRDSVRMVEAVAVADIVHVVGDFPMHRWLLAVDSRILRNSPARGNVVRMAHDWRTWTQ